MKKSIPKHLFALVNSAFDSWRSAVLSPTSAYPSYWQSDMELFRKAVNKRLLETEKELLG